MWSRTGRNIFFKSPQDRIWVAGYDVAGDTFLNQKPRLWSPVQIISPGNINLDLAPDGKHFAVFLSPEASAEKQGTLHVTFLLNFFDELRRRLPATGK